ncbi:glycosyltransferase, partial [Candidatus Uhrbacteria bacterium]|nr:glycosyltransferase [Candidatus Uhrbacteria bacterium]
MLRIALTLLSGTGYGGTTYFRNLLPTLAAMDDRNEYHCFVPERHSLIAALQVPNVHFHEVVRESTSAFERFRYEQLVLPRELRHRRMDLLYSAKNIAVFQAPCSQVIAIRNMEPFRYREFENAWTLDVQSRMKWEFTRRSIARADAIIAVSQAVRDAIVERFSSAAGKISVIYNGNSVHLNAERRTQNAEPPFFLTASKFGAY